jgi:putative drug exporter of the RND superfamily
MIDSTIVRTVLLPASKLLGDWNWSLPRALERLPKAPIKAPPAGETL